MGRKEKLRNLALVFLVVALDFLLGPGVLYLAKTGGGTVYRVTEAGTYPLPFLLQSLLLSLWPILLWVGMKHHLHKNFGRAMGFRLETPFQWIAVGALVLILGAMTALGISRTLDPESVLLSLVYYLLFVAMTEEFVIRGVCVYLLRKFDWRVQYLLPSFLFAAIHIFAFAGFRPLTWEITRRFFISEALGLTASGCCFQLLKSWTGTLWVPILIHAMLDFSILFTI